MLLSMCIHDYGDYKHCIVYNYALFIIIYFFLCVLFNVYVEVALLISYQYVRINIDIYII